MPDEGSPLVRVEFTPELKRDIRRLARKYRHLRSDLDPLIRQLESGETPGDRIQGVHLPVFKVRLKNSDAARGKSGGYRVIYYVQMRDVIILVTLYSKSEQGDVSAETIRSIVAEHEKP